MRGTMVEFLETLGPCSKYFNDVLTESIMALMWNEKFRWRRCGSSLPGLHTLDLLLSPPSEGRLKIVTAQLNLNSTSTRVGVTTYWLGPPHPKKLLNARPGNTGS